MRLDHLLSKEHLGLLDRRTQIRTNVPGWGLWVEHLTWHQRSWFLLVRRVFGPGWRVGVCERGACTLLGPEGPDAALGWCAIFSWAFGAAAVGGGSWGCRPYFENYTVDASILKMRPRFRGRVSR